MTPGETQVNAGAAEALGAALEKSASTMSPTTRGVDEPAMRSAPGHSAASHLSACCHGGAKMAVLAYSLGKREINQYFSIKNAKLLSLVAVILLTVFHTATRYYGGK